MNSQTYIGWILQQESDTYQVIQVDDDHLLLDSDLVEGEVNIYHLEVDVVELRLKEKKENENFFFLHFELKDEKHAQKLFFEMIDSLTKYNAKKTIKILLSCTSGLTTNFFAQKLNEAASALSLDYEFSAIAFPQIHKVGYDYDMILLAPQIAYEMKKVQEIFPKKGIFQIPPQIFGSYDTGALLEEIKKVLESYKQSKEEKAIAKVMRHIENNACIFVINVTHDIHETRYIERLYEAGNPLFTEEVIKPTASIEDVKDILDTQLRGIQKNFHVDAVAISTPGTILTEEGLTHIDYRSISDALSEEYKLPIFLCHNTSAIAYGYYAGQQKYNIITYHSQPTGALIGGQGTVYKGALINGAHHRGGEVRSLYEHIHQTKYEERDDITIEEIKDSLISSLVSNICTIDPEVILVRSVLTPDMDEIREELKKYIEEDHIPDLIYVDDISEYAYLGTMLYGLHALKKYNIFQMSEEE